MRTLAAALILAATPLAAHAADIQRVNNTLVFRGPIVMGDATRFAINLQAATIAGQPIRTVRMDSPGGLVTEGMNIAAQVRSAGLNVEVAEGGMCASACFLPFAAGAAKHVGQGARVGIHNASTTFGRTDNDAGTAMMALQAKGFGVPDRLLAQMQTETSAEMMWLSDEELASMGATVTADAAPVPMVASRADSVVSASGNSWSNPATTHYAQPEAGLVKAAPREYINDALARFNANPLHHAITGD